MELLFTIIVFIFVIGVMILVHEWGHFIAAKKIGIEVEVFSIGFGPSLLSWKRGGTEYRICVLPVGGYVKMLSENPDEGATGDPREFLSRTRFERFLVLVMGPVLNILLAFLIWTAILMVGVQRPQWYIDPPRVDYLTPGSPAEREGIRQGDEIVKINGRPMRNWEDLLYAVVSSPREDILVTVRRDGRLIDYTVTPEEDERRGFGSIGIRPGVPAIIYGVEKGKPADKAGLREGDKVLAIDGVEVTTFNDIQELVVGRSLSVDTLRALGPSWPMLAALERVMHGGGTLELEVGIQRGDETFSALLLPEYDPEVGFRRIGITQPPTPTVTVRYGLLEAPGRALDLCVVNIGRLFDIVGKMITGRLSSKAISGPLEIASISGQTAVRGIIPLLELMAFISLNLGIINLLPLPVLDGGNILILTLEGVARRDISLKTKEWIMRVGVFMLLLLMALVLYQDLEKLIFNTG